MVPIARAPDSALYRVACVAKKRPDRATARDLYVSPWFQKARAYVESIGHPWFILSAKHGLVEPDVVLEPYEVTLNTMSASERRTWASLVWKRLRPRLASVQRVTILAGLRYREHLVPRLRERGVEVVVPLEGLGIGKQLRWLKGHADGVSDVSNTAMNQTVHDHLTRFYDLLSQLHNQVGGFRRLEDCGSQSGWPARGVYFFLESVVDDRLSVHGHRVSRVGTHAVSAGSRATLWRRLRQHRGTMRTGGGNHRGSIFRLLVGEALLRRDGSAHPTWGNKESAPREVRAREVDLERRVSAYIRELPLLWIEADDEPGRRSIRADIERNSIALLSQGRAHGASRTPADWLGNSSSRELVSESGLWNNRHVFDDYDPSCLDRLEPLIGTTQCRER